MGPNRGLILATKFDINRIGRGMVYRLSPPRQSLPLRSLHSARFDSAAIQMPGGVPENRHHDHQAE
jgi:hypothetical protein